MSRKADNNTLFAWVASIPGVGPKWFSILFAKFPDLQELLTISAESLQNAHIPEKLSRSIVEYREVHTPEDIEEFVTKEKILLIVNPAYTQNAVERDPSLITQDDKKGYPSLLSEIPDPPVVLYLKGEMPDFSLPAIGVVGTRKITSYGTKVTKELTAQLVRAGLVIVSGFMYGVDAVAHQTAIEHGGKTIGVLGYGLGVPFYPQTHDRLATQLLESGSCLITEFAPWQSAIPSNFPRRNRIVSGMSLGIVVTEAAKKSGSLITASLAVDQGREVFAVPGPIHSPYSEGTKALINMGAKLVTTGQDILEELNIGSEAARNESRSSLPPQFSSTLEEAIYTYIVENTEVSLDELLMYSKIPARELSVLLAKFELLGLISQTPGTVHLL